jgi:peptide/nickel transport system substrate-binding protein
MGAFPEQQGAEKPHRFRPGRWRLATAFGTAAVALVAAACGSGGGSNGSAPARGTPVSGGTASYALPPSTAPNYIFPFTSSSYDLVVNTDYFQYLMYRPLYWFGDGANPTLNPSLSLADQPVYKGNQVTITLKGWKWSNGETVSAQDVVFWIHMLQAVGSADWGAYVPGGFPGNVSYVKAVSPTELTMTTDKAYNPTWFTYNELSQITPMPKAWDRTASGPSDCTNVVADCAKVYAYLGSQSKAVSGWASSPVWSVVDGPWKLASFSADGNSTFVPNKAYSGSPKPRLAKFQEVPFTTENAEYNMLRAGAAGSQKIDVGYLPMTVAPDKPIGATAGANPVNGYTLSPLYSWSINYFPMNFQSTTGNGPVIRQLYFRQAMEYVMNQKTVIQGPLRGYGLYTVGPVGSYPSTSFLSAQGMQGDPFPYDPAKAKRLLTSHGWNVVPNGTTTCVKPSLCGPGVMQGKKLVFTLPYATGTTWIGQEMTQLHSSASLVGIKLNLEPKPFDQMTTIAGGNCVAAHISCAWDMGDWGSGWRFSPDYYPTGETLFLSSSAANSSGYTDARNDTLIDQTLTSSSPQSLYAWQDYLAAQAPVVWQPNGAYELSEVASNLRGVTPQSTTLAINPENWYFVK